MQDRRVKTWHYSASGESRGPVNNDEIQRLLREGEISHEALVWTEGMVNWEPIRNLPDFDISPYAPPLLDPVPGHDWNPSPPTGPQLRPWVRYWARTFDMLLAMIVIGMVVGLAFPQWLESDTNDYAFGLAVMALMILAEPVMFMLWGTTPMKAYFKIRVRNRDGSKLGGRQALRRTLNVWLRGLGLGIPLVSLITQVTSCSRLSTRGCTVWDESGGFVVSHRIIGAWRVALVFLLVVGFVGLAAA